LERKEEELKQQPTSVVCGEEKCLIVPDLCWLRTNQEMSVVERLKGRSLGEYEQQEEQNMKASYFWKHRKVQAGR